MSIENIDIIEKMNKRILFMTSERLKQVRISMNYSQAQFASLLGIAQSTYAKYELGGGVPEKTLLFLAEKGIDLHWLITGEGSMYRINNHSDENLEKSTYITPSGKSYSVEISDGGLSVPILASKVSAGVGLEWLPQDFKENERLPILKRFTQGYDIKKIFSAEVNGDSMINANILDGDIVYAVAEQSTGDGLYVIAVDGNVFVKRLEYDPFECKVKIISENERYETKIVDPERIIVLGKVLGWLHRYPY